MFYKALYRKLRPKTFSEISGQEDIVKTLKNQIMTGRISHAYIFSGTRGTGKTSISKIFAKAVNCENPLDGEPCGECSFCLYPKEDVAMIINEFDAASNNGVDSIREIIDSVKYPPAFGKFKVYIIDEVHMLSIGAFNALLKTLEDPPDHVVFILATTEPHKIPQTVHSRCQRFDFKRIPAKNMFETLTKQMIAEKISITTEALNYVVRVSDGAMRNSQSILDQCISFYYDEEITVDKVQNLLGSVSNDVFAGLINAIHEKNSFNAIDLIDQLVDQGKDVKQFVSELIVYLRNTLVAISTNNNELIDNSDEEISFSEILGKKIGVDKLLIYITEFSELNTKTKYSANERILLEVTCLKLCTQTNASTDHDKMFKLLNDKIELISKRKNISTPQESDPLDKIKPIPVLQKAIPEDIKQAISKWNEFVVYVLHEKKEGMLNGLLKDGSVKFIDGNNKITITFENETSVNLGIEKHKNNLETYLSEYFDRHFEVEFISISSYNNKHNEKYGSDDTFDYNALQSFENNLNNVTLNQMN